MKNKKLNCTDLDLGNLILHYELGMLGEKEKSKFEDHTFDCAFCRHELEEMAPTALLLRDNKVGLKELLRTEEVLVPTTDSEKENSTNLIAGFLVQIIQIFRIPKVYTPAIGFSLAVIALFMFYPAFEKDSYEQFLVFEKLPERNSTLRGNDISEYPDYYQRTIEGIDFFLDNKPDKAIRSLTVADSLAKYALQSEIWWYLFQSYLLNNDLPKADSVRILLSEQEDEYSEKCDSVWTLIEEKSRK